MTYFSDKLIWVDAGRHYCTTCDKHYKSKEALNSHLYYDCRKLKAHQCPYCDHKTKRKYDLNKHIQVKH